MKAIEARNIFESRIEKELKEVFELIKATSLHNTVQYMTMGIWSVEDSNIRRVCSDRLEELGYEVNFHNNITQIRW